MVLGRFEACNYPLPAVRREGRAYSNANERKDKIRGEEEQEARAQNARTRKESRFGPC